MHKTMRQVHRWLSVPFTLAVIANLVGIAVLGPDQTEVGMAIGFMAVVPLIPMLLTGIYLFLQPYLAKRGAAASAQ